MEKNELICKKCFDKYLVHIFPEGKRKWEKGTEPPDYFLLFNNKQFAIEVSTITEQLISDNKKYPVKSYISSTRKLVKSIEENAIRRGILKGAYIIDLKGPFDRFSKARKKILNNALSYIQNTKKIPSSNKAILFKSHQQSCSIKKIHNNSDKLYPITSSGSSFKWEGEILKEACELLQNVLSTKKKKLKDITLPKILLLKHEYIYEDPIVYKECAINSDLVKYYHSVFIVENQNNGYLLYTCGFN